MYNTIVVREKQKKQTRNDQDGSLAQLGEHLPYKQRVIGSSPIGPTDNCIVAVLVWRNWQTRRT